MKNTKINPIFFRPRIKDDAVRSTDWQKEKIEKDVYSIHPEDADETKKNRRVFGRTRKNALNRRSIHTEDSTEDPDKEEEKKGKKRFTIDYTKINPIFFRLHINGAVRSTDWQEEEIEKDVYSIHPEDADETKENRRVFGRMQKNASNRHQ